MFMQKLIWEIIKLHQPLIKELIEYNTSLGRNFKLKRESIKIFIDPRCLNQKVDWYSFYRSHRDKRLCPPCPGRSRVSDLQYGISEVLISRPRASSMKQLILFLSARSLHKTAHHTLKINWIVISVKRTT